MVQQGLNGETCDYRATHEGILWVRQAGNQTTEVRLTNFTAKTRADRITGHRVRPITDRRRVCLSRHRSDIMMLDRADFTMDSLPA